MVSPMTDKLLSGKQAAALLDVAPITLRVWRQRGKGPDYIEVGGRIKYRESAIAAWLEERTRRPE